MAKPQSPMNLHAQGITLVDADVVARQVVEPSSPCLETIKEKFGPDILQADGSLNRAELRARIFADPEAKAWLNGNLMHPQIRKQMLDELAAARSPYSILIAPHCCLKTDWNNTSTSLSLWTYPRQIQTEPHHGTMTA